MCIILKITLTLSVFSFLLDWTMAQSTPPQNMLCAQRLLQEVVTFSTKGCCNPGNRISVFDDEEGSCKFSRDGVCRDNTNKRFFLNYIWHRYGYKTRNLNSLYRYMFNIVGSIFFDRMKYTSESQWCHGKPKCWVLSAFYIGAIILSDTSTDVGS